MELESFMGFRVAVQELADVQRRIASSRPTLVEGEVELNRSGPMSTPSLWCHPLCNRLRPRWRPLTGCLSSPPLFGESEVKTEETEMRLRSHY